jgi:glycosyltransferase involved in cell wall biosynthesis
MESGENAAFRTESSILRRFGETVIEYTRDSREIQGAPALSVFLNGFFNQRTVREVSNIVQHERPDLAIVQNVFPLISPSLYSILYRHQIPIVQVVYNYRFMCPNGHFFTNGQICNLCSAGNMIHAVAHGCFRKSLLQSTWYALILTLHRKLFLRTIAAYIVPDDFMIKTLSQGGFPARKMFINSAPFDVSPVPPLDLFEDYVLFVGRLEPQKGAATLLRAMFLVQNPIKAVIVGEGVQEVELRALAAELDGRITFTGPLYGEKMEALLRRALAVIIPSEWYDNAPLTLYHAFAHGKPVIASNINGLPELVKDEENGFLFKPGSPAQLAERINFVANNRTLASAMGKRARLKAETELDAPIHYRRLRAVLEFCKKQVRGAPKRLSPAMRSVSDRLE